MGRGLVQLVGRSSGRNGFWPTCSAGGAPGEMVRPGPTACRSPQGRRVSVAGFASRSFSYSRSRARIWRLATAAGCVLRRATQ